MNVTASTTARRTTARRTTARRAAFAVPLAAVAVQAAMVFAFTAPAANMAPHRIPVAVAAPAPAVAAVEAKLDAARPGAFAVTPVADEAAARTAIAHRDVYGAIVVTPEGPHTLVASAASPAVSQALTEVGDRLAQQGPDPRPAVADVVPAAARDPRGAAFTSMVLPLVMSGLAGGVLLTLAVPRVRDRAAGLALFAIGGGLAVAAIAGPGLGFLPGSFWALSGALALSTAAVAGTTAGAAAVLGRPGLGLSGVTMMLLANPLSAAASAPELLPTPWGALGQDLPAGAAATLIRSTAFFDGNGTGHALTVLAAWIAGAGALLVLGAVRQNRAVGAEDEADGASEAAGIEIGNAVSVS